jgi:DNA-binding response OmpR family regulator
VAKAWESGAFFAPLLGAPFAVSPTMVPSEPPPFSRAVLRRPRILLVDDDPSVIRGLWRILRRCRPDFQINTAGSAFQALGALAELSYDAVITDLQMPGGGGKAVLEALAADHPETARIVHSSQLESVDTEVRSLSHVVLAKPASESELLDAVDLGLQRVANQRGKCGSAR